MTPAFHLKPNPSSGITQMTANAEALEFSAGLLRRVGYLETAALLAALASDARRAIQLLNLQAILLADAAEGGAQ